MKKPESNYIIGLDLGTTSIGWAVVREGDDAAIIKAGVRVIPLSTDEVQNFSKGKAITTNQDRTLKRGARRSLQRYKLRRKELVRLLIKAGILSGNELLNEEGKDTTYETIRLRAEAVTQEISKAEFTRVLISINKKRGYKSSRKTKGEDEGEAIDGIQVAKELQLRMITAGQYALEQLEKGSKQEPVFYPSDLQAEYDAIWSFQKQFHAGILTDSLYDNLKGKTGRVCSAIVWSTCGFNTAENKGKPHERKRQLLLWRVAGIKKELSKEELMAALVDLNDKTAKSSDYLGKISDRSKKLAFNDQTIGQYQWKQIQENRHARLKGQVFYRKDYINEFDALWKEQSKHHKELTEELRIELRDKIMFYQRSLKSQKGKISICELEGKKMSFAVEGKDDAKERFVGPRVCAKSSPLFQEFRIWQRLNDLKVYDKTEESEVVLEEEQKQALFEEVTWKAGLKNSEVLKMLFKKPRNFELNFKDVVGNRTNANLLEAYQDILTNSGHDGALLNDLSGAEITETLQAVFETLGINSDILKFNASLDLDQQASFQLWHLLYSYAGDNSNTGDESLIRKLQEKFGFDTWSASRMAKITFEEDYGNLSSKALVKLLPHLKDGFNYADAALMAGYSHSHAETVEQRDAKNLLDELRVLDKNTLRNPVVEKILNQIVHVVNGIMESYGRPKEIRLEMARELKNSAKERKKQTEDIAKASRTHEEMRLLLQHEFGLSYVSRNDIIRYKLYKELEHRGHKTLYSNRYISPDLLFSKEIDVEHIIPKSRVFDDSFSNKTLEFTTENKEKGNQTAYDYVDAKYGEAGLQRYLAELDSALKSENISYSKYNKLKMKQSQIPDGFIARDLRDSQYIAKYAKEMLGQVCRVVNTTTGKVTDRLRQDWQLVHVMQDLNWEKYDKLGLTFYDENREGRQLRRIKGWNKRNDHRHHAMDAIAVAFTKHNHVQYLNYLNARLDETHEMTASVKSIESNELEFKEGKWLFKPPMPLNKLRAEAKEQLENILVSFKAKNKVLTPNLNRTKKNEAPQKTSTPRGQLHNETIYGSQLIDVVNEVKVNGSMDQNMLAFVTKPLYRELLMKRLQENDNDPKKAFTGKNSLEKNPLFLDEAKGEKMPEKVKIKQQVVQYTIRKSISPDLKIEKVLDKGIQRILEKRLKDHQGDAKKAFSNLDEDPIWLNKEKGIQIKNVTITGISTAVALGDKRDHHGNKILDEAGNTIPSTFVSTGNNHHVAIYQDEKGKYQEDVASFFQAVTRANAGLPIVNKTFNRDLGWTFCFTMKQNEYFVFPNTETGFDPNELDLLDPSNNLKISPNLFRVQKISTKNYMFRHHLDTNVEEERVLANYAFKNIRSTTNLISIVKVRVNHLGMIVEVGEY